LQGKIKTFQDKTLYEVAGYSLYSAILCTFYTDDPALKWWSCG